MELTPRRLNRATLHRQLLLARRSVDVHEGVRNVVAVQAQEAPSPYVAMWNRLHRFDPAQLDTAIADHSIVKASLMRITLHAVVAEDYPAFHEAMTPILRAARVNDRRFHEAATPIEDADELMSHVLAFATEPRTKDEIEAAMAERIGEEPHSRLWWAMKTYAPIFHAPTAQPWSFGRRPSYRAAPSGRRPPFEEALQYLIRRYLEGFGPASVLDFNQFSMQSRVAIRQALDSMSHELEVLEGPEGEVLYDVPDGVIPDEETPAPPRLLAMWDSTLLAYNDRSRLIPEEYRKAVIRNNGDVLPTLLVDGYVAGVWRPVEDGIEVTAFHDIPTTAWRAIEAEAASLIEMLAPREHLIYSRYRNWWQKLPEGVPRVVGV
jgi:hypothetical protein